MQSTFHAISIANNQVPNNLPIPVIITATKIRPISLQEILEKHGMLYTRFTPMRYAKR